MMPMVSATQDSTELRASFGRAADRLQSMLYEALVRTTELAASYARMPTYYTPRSYVLRQSIKTGVQMGQRGGVGVVRASAPYAAFVEYGTKPHRIEPRRKAWLRFEQNGVIRFSKGVNHPGTAPRPFMREAQKRATPFFERMVAEAFHRAFT